MLVAKDIMTRDVITISHMASLRELSKLLSEKGITGVPVIDEDKRLLGMVSMRDLIREEVRSLGANLEYQDIYELFSSALNTEEAEGVSVRHLWVEEIMSPALYTATESTPVHEICRMMCTHKVHRIPILEDGKVIGLVTAMDVIKMVSEGK
ncbi:MAG: CBS domain-containing protein [Candidatus Hydrogenedentota bacterium]|nr:MAG: CBS domain-containing protein [Candidatus Hydrogenedentota bacterium]